jgi:hypothetical protein
MYFLNRFTANLICHSQYFESPYSSAIPHPSYCLNLFYANLDGGQSKKVLLRDHLDFDRRQLDMVETFDESYCQSETRLLA